MMSEPTPVCAEPASEFVETLTGYDEIAIAKRFEADITELRSRGTMFLRCLVFVHLCREGARHADAYTKALEMPFRDVNGYFAPEPKKDTEGEHGPADDGEPDPETESGKDD